MLDPFAGSALTMIAAHQNRTAGPVELDPSYCDIMPHPLDEQRRTRHRLTGRRAAERAFDLLLRWAQDPPREQGANRSSPSGAKASYVPAGGGHVRVSGLTVR